jgi:outer membrane protein OmpA-like peptidoglycan-associated protein
MNNRIRAAFVIAAMVAAPAWADDLSTSVMRPTPLDPASGLISGRLPGGQGSTSWYVSVDLQPGDLVTQLQISGTPNTGKRLDLELLDAAARVTDSVYVMAGLDAKADVTKAFPIDRAGRYVIRLIAEGKESGTFCMLIGGTALPSANAAGCPASAGGAAVVPPRPAPAPVVVAVPQPVPVAPPAPPAPPAAKPVEVIISKCEERLRVGSDFLFDFNRAEVRPEAEPAMVELAQRIAAADKAILIEGHTDAIGSESYNQGLSERRAAAVRSTLVGRGLRSVRLDIRGFGKSRPVVPNQRSDGTDDPDGRQRNRRVEVVINTCS